ncbi:MAG TPA: cytochrome o ubiquinol oxidase subunit IV [Acetobacteraceae bacterium]|nr:cytochrome o ubiquinol oxidase subunit IV [Acetobacteraceae bacterium]
MAGANAAHAGVPHGDGEAHASVRGYVTGFILSVLLTAVPFALVMSGTVPAATAVPAAIGLAVVQMVVHLVYFLHMNRASSQSWNMAALVFTVIIVAILVAGSLWIMYHMNANMMPGMMPPE